MIITITGEWQAPTSVYCYIFQFSTLLLYDSCYDVMSSNEYRAPLFPDADEHASPADDDEGGENTRGRTPNVAQ